MPFQQIDSEGLKALMASTPELLVLDVRTPEEFAYIGHIPNATLLPLQQLPMSWQQLDRERPTVVLCQHGVRSLDACYYLEQAGFSRLYNLVEGMSTWDGPVEREPLPQQ
jgi:rhodanese-related sulfurtransferase